MKLQKQKSTKDILSILILFVMSIFFYNGYAQQPTLTWPGTLGRYSSDATVVSSDGQYIVGQGLNGTTGQYEGYLLSVSGTSPVDETQFKPENFKLDQNYPNPFNPSTSIKYRASLT
jgi:hypothetical protein